jgi:hypothetical protein
MLYLRRWHRDGNADAFDTVSASQPGFSLAIVKPVHAVAPAVASMGGSV